LVCLGALGLRVPAALAQAADADEASAESELDERSKDDEAGEQDSAPRPASGGAEEVPAAALALFEEGRELVAAGRHERACDKFEHARAIFAGIGVRFHLAACWERVGKTASAHALFLEVEAATRELGQTERAAVARERAAGLAAKLSYLKVEVNEPVDGLTVRHRQASLDESQWSQPFAVDPGPHAVSARAPEHAPWSQTVDVPREPGVVTIRIPALEPAAKPKAKPAVAAEPPKAEPVAERAPEADRGTSSGQRTAALVLGGVGVGALLTGATFAVLYKASNDDAKAVCPSSMGCTGVEMDTHDQLVDDAKRARTLAFVGLGVGAAALGVAAYFFFNDPGAASGTETARVRAVPLVGSDGTLGGALDVTW
jgi:serine/threonine-protein kinase